MLLVDINRWKNVDNMQYSQNKMTHHKLFYINNFCNSMIKSFWDMCLRTKVINKKKENLALLYQNDFSKKKMWNIIFESFWASFAMILRIQHKLYQGLFWVCIKCYLALCYMDSSFSRKYPCPTPVSNTYSDIGMTLRSFKYMEKLTKIE